MSASIGQLGDVFSSHRSSCSTLGWWTLHRASSGALQAGHRSPSVYGGAGGFGTRVSLTGAGESAVVEGTKVTMQNLNDRLASYIDKVRFLEDRNRQLELNIREFCLKKKIATNDFSTYFSTIAALQAEITRSFSENQNILLKIDNSKLAAEDFKNKFEVETNMSKTLEADLLRLREIRDDLTLAISRLETTAEELKEELVCTTNSHEQEMDQLRLKGSGMVNVEVDSAESIDLTRVLEEMRVKYETVVKTNKLELEKWHQSKVAALQEQITSCTTEVKTYHAEISELKRTYESLEITRQSLHAEIECLQRNEAEASAHFSARLSQHQDTIGRLEAELQQMKAALQKMTVDYSVLLDIKTRLEQEIAEYRRLLDGEEFQEKAVIIVKQTEQVEEHKPHIEKRVKTIVEQIVDGKVVSSSTDTQVHTIQ